MIRHDDEYINGIYWRDYWLIIPNRNPVITVNRQQSIFDHLRDHALLSVGVDTEWTAEIVKALKKIDNIKNKRQVEGD